MDIYIYVSPDVGRGIEGKGEGWGDREGKRQA